MQQPFLALLAGDTGAFDTLNEISLTEEIYNKQGCHNEKRRGILDSRGEERAARLLGCRVKRCRNLEDLREGEEVNRRGEED